MFNSRYYDRKFICTNEDGIHTLCDVSNTFSGREYCKYIPDEEKEGDYAIYLLRNPKQSFKDTHITPLRTFLMDKGYSDNDFRNPFNRTRKIVNEIDTINQMNKPKIKQK